MSAENRALIRRWFEEVWGEGREETINELFHPEGIAHVDLDRDVSGPAGVKQLRRMMLTAFPDLQMTLEAILADGDEVGVRWSARGTHQGELAAIPPTHKEVRLRGATWARIADGRIVEFWINGNLADVYRRLLDQAASEIKILRGILPICAECKRIKNDEGYWEQVELYVRNHSAAEFSHGLCPGCAERLYPDLVGER